MRAWIAWLFLFLFLAFAASLAGCGCITGDDDDDDSDADDDDDSGDDDDDDSADDDDDNDYDCEDPDQSAACENQAQAGFDACDDDCYENADCITSCSAACDVQFYYDNAACACDGSSWQDLMLCLAVCWQDLADCYDANSCTDVNCSDPWQTCHDTCQYG